MSKFKTRREKGTPAISTASLPDIVFMLLFFFMTVTKMRSTEVMVKIKIPKASEVTKITDKKLVHYIYIGQPMDEAMYGSGSRIQVNDAFILKSDIPAFIETERAKMPEYKKSMIITALKADVKVKMGIITDVKKQLRDANQLKLMYYTNKKSKK